MFVTDSNREFCIEMLPKVSRTFAPTIRMLPKKLYLPVNVAYLLCRVADTVEDTAYLEKSEKQELLRIYANIFKGSYSSGKDAQDIYFKRFMEGIKSLPDGSNEVYLVKSLDKILSVYHDFSKHVRKYIANCVIEMSLGMRKYAQSRGKRKFQFLRSMKELDEYTYYVAGTVGKLLTYLFAHFSRKINPEIRKRLELFSESFGKGLQLVNIIRDMTADLKRGQSYIPDEILQKYELNRASVYEAKNYAQAEKLFNELISLAVKHLDKALAYIIRIPKEEARIRLFCLLPLCWAMQTLKIIQINTLHLLQSNKVKISRRIIHVEFLKSLILIFSNRLTIRHYKKIRKNIEREPIPALLLHISY
jgi:farnesyl-diphosphate farnesyltransferase